MSTTAVGIVLICRATVNDPSEKGRSSRPTSAMVPLTLAAIPVEVSNIEPVPPVSCRPRSSVVAVVAPGSPRKRLTLLALTLMVRVVPAVLCSNQKSPPSR